MERFEITESGGKSERLENFKKPLVYIGTDCGQGSKVDGVAKEQFRLLSQQSKGEELESCVKYSSGKPRCAPEGFPLGPQPFSFGFNLVIHTSALILRGRNTMSRK